MELELSVRQTLDIKLVPASAPLLELPTGSLDSLIRDVTDNSETYERKIEEAKSRGEKPGIQSFFPLQTQPTGRKPRGGIITSPSLKAVVESERSSKPTIDGVYVPRGIDAPEFLASEFLEGVPLSAFLIPSSKNAKNLILFLIKERNWIAKQLKAAYNHIGAEQREFIATLDDSLMNLYSMIDLAKEMDLSPSTISRLMRNRYVAIKHGNENFVVPTGFFFTHINGFLYSKRRKIIDRALAEESETGKAFSDDKLADRIHLPRRTLAKYRQMSSVPDIHGRQKAYDEGRKKPYQTRTSFELFCGKR